MHSHTLADKSSLLRAGQVAGSVTTAASLVPATSPSVVDLCDIVEFRADALADRAEEVQSAMTRCRLPVLLTVRSPAEGGMGGLSLRERERLFQQLLPHAHLVDIEIAHLRDLEEVLQAATQRGVAVVASFHDFHGTPDPSSLMRRMEEAMAAGATAVKFATTLRNTANLAVLAALQEEATIPLSTMGMGPLGRVSRLLLGTLGSVLNYGYLDQPTIPGQWPAARLKILIAETGGQEE